MSDESPPAGDGPAPDPGRRNRTLRSLAFVVVPGLFVAFLAAALLVTKRPRSEVGARVPSFSLPQMGSGARISDRDLIGSPVVMNFWASWCIPCREEAPLLEQAWEKHRGEGIRFIGVDTNDAADDAAAFIKEFHITYPSVRDVDQRLGTAFGVTGLPETFFVKRNGKFQAAVAGPQVGSRGSTAVRGAISAAVLRGNIDSLLGTPLESPQP